jgi:N-methylhydantoinase A/oxoprolinase/acetone carboxylase beta subunit
MPATDLPPEPDADEPERGRREAVFEGERVDAQVVRGAPAAALDGPAIVELAEATLVVPPGWRCSTADDGTIVMERG